MVGAVFCGLQKDDAPTLLHEVIDLPTALRAKKEGLQANESSYRAD